MARNKVQFQKGLSEAEFDELYGTEERCTRRSNNPSLKRPGLPVAPE